MFHYKPQKQRMGDPNGPCYWNGKYHMFYQHMDDREDCVYVIWGHAVSTDLLTWEELPDAIFPFVCSKPGDPGYSGAAACWSGGVCVDKDRVVAVFYGHSNDPETCGLYVMTSSDPMLLHWENVTEGPVIFSIDQLSEANDPNNPLPYDSVPYCAYPMLYDPFIWVEDDVYYLLSSGVCREKYTGSLRRNEELFTSTDLVHWTHQHSLITDGSYGEAGDDGGCPYFMPWNDGKTPGEDHRLLWHLSHQLGPRYVMGIYDKDSMKFTPYNGNKLHVLPQRDGYAVSALFTGVPDNSMLAVHVMWTREGSGTMSMVHRLERCGEYLEDISVLPAADLDSFPVNYTPKPGEEDCIRPGGKTAVLKLRISYDPKKAYPVLYFHRKDGSVFGNLRLHAGAGLRKRRNRMWVPDDLAVLSIEDRPDADAQQIVPLHATNGIWEMTIVLDEEIMEIFYPDALSMGRILYADTDDMYLSLEGGRILSR